MDYSLPRPYSQEAPRSRARTRHCANNEVVVSHSSTETRTDLKRESSVDSESALGAAGGLPKPTADNNIRDFNFHHHHHHYHHYGEFGQQQEEFRPNLSARRNSQAQNSSAGLEGLPSYEEAVSQNNTYLRHGPSPSPYDQPRDEERARSISQESRQRFRNFLGFGFARSGQGTARHSTPRRRFRTPIHSPSGSERSQADQPRIETSQSSVELEAALPAPTHTLPTPVDPEDILADTLHIFDDLVDSDSEGDSLLSLPDLETIPSSGDNDIGEHQISILIRTSRGSLRGAFLTAVLRVLGEDSDRSRGFEHRA